MWNFWIFFSSQRGQQSIGASNVCLEGVCAGGFVHVLGHRCMLLSRGEGRPVAEGGQQRPWRGCTVLSSQERSEALWTKGWCEFCKQPWSQGSRNTYLVPPSTQPPVCPVERLGASCLLAPHLLPKATPSPSKPTPLSCPSPPLPPVSLPLFAQWSAPEGGSCPFRYPLGWNPLTRVCPGHPSALQPHSPPGPSSWLPHTAPASPQRPPPSPKGVACGPFGGLPGKPSFQEGQPESTPGATCLSRSPSWDSRDRNHITQHPPWSWHHGCDATWVPRPHPPKCSLRTPAWPEGQCVTPDACSWPPSIHTGQGSLSDAENPLTEVNR